MSLRPSISGPSWLWCAWACPALLTVPQAPSAAAAAAGALVAAATAGALAFLPGRVWKAACAGTVVALPFTVWWCGCAAVGGAGPGYDAAVAALQTNVQEALGAASFVRGRTLLIVVVGAHLACLALALRAAFARPVHATAALARTRGLAGWGWAGS